LGVGNQATFKAEHITQGQSDGSLRRWADSPEAAPDQGAVKGRHFV